MNRIESHSPFAHEANEPGSGAAALPGQARSVTMVLRWLGAITLIAAGGCYLVSSWMEASPLTRFYVFLGFTAFLAVAGMFCGLRWREDKGARTFLALSALFIPACAAQIAGFLYVQLGGAAAPYEIFRIDPIGESALSVAAIAFALTALPTIFLAFSALARPEAGRLTLAYLVGNLVLILPQREPGVVLGIAAGLLGFLLVLDQCFFARAAMLKHRDGLAMRAALFLPLLILVTRNLMLFGDFPGLTGFAFGAVGALLFLGFPGLLLSEGLKTFSRGAGFSLMTIGWAIVAEWILGFQGVAGVESVVPVGLLPLAGLAMALSLAAGRDGRAYRRLAGAGAVAVLLLHLAAFGGDGIILLSLAAAVALMAGAFWVSDRVLFISGVLGFAVTLAHVLFSAREFWAQNLWVSLGGLGVVILIASSLIERNWHRLTLGAAAIREGWEEWE